jgi:hypothetical protein
MGYKHIPNLYKQEATPLLLFKEVYALEKIHGTSARIRLFHDVTADAGPGMQGGGRDRVTFFSGGAKHDQFVALFDQEDLLRRYREHCPHGGEVTIYGEAYGGKMQGMRDTYGDRLRFVAFEVKGKHFWDVPKAHEFVEKMGLEFVHYNRVPATLEALDAERDAPSVQAVRNGILEPRQREGIVIRPVQELILNEGGVLRAKHKRPDFCETRSKREIQVGGDPEKLKVLEDAMAIADEWVTEMRLRHVLDKLPQGIGMEGTKQVIDAMVQDVLREGKGEIVPSKEAIRAVGTSTAKLFKRHLDKRLREENA